MLGDRGLSITTDWGSQHLIGGPGNDYLDATNGSDILEGKGGNDVLDGGDGLDMAIFSGRSSQYNVNDNGSHLTVSGNGEGANTLYSIEIIQFSDGNFVYSPELRQLVKL